MTADFSASGMNVSMSPSATLIQKVCMFFGHYDLRVYVSESGYLDIGRGSFSAALTVKFLQKDFSGCVGTVGQFCDFSENCTLFGGGDHKNNLPVNVVMSNVPAFYITTSNNRIDDLRSKDPQPFKIGNAVVISADVKVLGGASIGDGSLLAASSVVSGAVDAFSIYGGVPAKKIKDRLPESAKEALAKVRWWDFDMTYLGNNLHRLQELAIDEQAAHIYRKESPRFVINLQNHKVNGDVTISGFLKDSEFRPLSDAPQKVRDYVFQLAGPGPYRWMPDIWND